MRKALTLGALALVLVVVVAYGPPLPDSRLAIHRATQTGAAVLMYDEDGNPEWVDEAYPGSITNNPSDVFYSFYGYSDAPQYSYEPYDVYDPYYGGYSSPYDYSYNDPYYSGNSSNSSSGAYDFYTPPLPPPPPPPQPWYVQALPGIGNVAQTIVQGLAPQTRVPQRPTCSITSNPRLVRYDGSAMLQWSSQGAEWADLTELGTVDRSGSWQFDGFTRTRTFTLNVTGPGGAGTCSTVVTVQSR